MSRILFVVWLMGMASWVSAERLDGAPAQPLATTEQAAEILDWLEVLTAARQADRLIAQSLDRQVALNAEQRSELGAILTAATGSDAVVASVRAYIAQHSSADWGQALRVYQSPIARRARNFDVALGLSTAADKFHHYQQQVAVSDTRRQLVRRLDGLLHCSEIAVILQTEIDASTEMLAAAKLKAELPPQGRGLHPRALQFEQRRMYMAKVTEDLLLYAYRFLKDDELKELVEQLDDPAVRAITDTALKAFVQVLKAGRAVALTNS